MPDETPFEQAMKQLPAKYAKQRKEMNEGLDRSLGIGTIAEGGDWPKVGPEWAQSTSKPMLGNVTYSTSTTSNVYSAKDAIKG